MSCYRFDVGPIISQELYEVPEYFTADELGSALACIGAQLVIIANLKLMQYIHAIDHLI